MIRERDAASTRAKSARCHPGLTMVEIIVVLAIVAILGAALGPSMIGVMDRNRVESASESLDAIVTAMSNMRGDNQDWPGRLSHLAWPITTSDANICGGLYQSGKVGNWAGPYLDRNVPTSGIPIGIGTVQDVLVREIPDPLAPNDGYLKIQINDVVEEDALELDRIYDDDGSVAGSIRWGAVSASGQVTVFMLRPIRGC